MPFLCGNTHFVTTGLLKPPFCIDSTTSRGKSPAACFERHMFIMFIGSTFTWSEFLNKKLSWVYQGNLFEQIKQYLIGQQVVLCEIIRKFSKEFWELLFSVCKVRGLVLARCPRQVLVWLTGFVKLKCWRHLFASLLKKLSINEHLSVLPTSSRKLCPRHHVMYCGDLITLTLP